MKLFKYVASEWIDFHIILFDIVYHAELNINGDCWKLKISYYLILLVVPLNICIYEAKVVWELFSHTERALEWS